MNRPALEPEEWAVILDALGGDRGGLLRAMGPKKINVQEPAEAQRIAALALYSQPFGFSWDDVDAIRTVADRIAALLPPREP